MTSRQQRFVQQLSLPMAAPWMNDRWPAADPVNAVLVGAGGFGTHLANGARLVPGLQIKAVVEKDLATAQKVAASLGIPHYFGSLKDFGLARKQLGIDVLFNETPNRDHPKILKWALSQKMGVFGDKPISPSPWNASRHTLMKLIEANPMPSAVGFTYLAKPEMRKAKQMIDLGLIGEVLYVNLIYPQRWCAFSLPDFVWRKFAAEAGNGGCLDDIFVHTLSVLMFFGLQVDELFCRTAIFHPQDKRDVPDYAVVIGTLLGGAEFNARVEQDNHGHLNGPYVEIVGTLGTLKIGRESGVLVLCRKGKADQTFVVGERYDLEAEDLQPAFPANDWTWLKVWSDHGGHGLYGTLALHLQAFAWACYQARAAIRDGRTWTAPAGEWIYALMQLGIWADDVVYAAEKSARTKRMVKVKYTTTGLALAT